MHERKKQGSLSASEQQTYADLQEAFARAVLAVQGLTCVSASARQTFRVAVMLRIEIMSAGRVWKVATIDLSAGGFSAVLDHKPDRNRKFDFAVVLRKEDVLRGSARVVGARDDGSGSRVSFAFEALDAADQTKLEDFLYDSALARLPT
jgi:c-di-GMP-binding flagellar brake protein YcgR